MSGNPPTVDWHLLNNPLWILLLPRGHVLGRVDRGVVLGVGCNGHLAEHEIVPVGRDLGPTPPEAQSISWVIGGHLLSLGPVSIDRTKGRNLTLVATAAHGTEEERNCNR